ncbi:MAG TPA: tetratricopeptide repeat protein [Chitinophagales bacterium]|nr:tetratricopeptide repeat protein [Chitinophagales bacterium]HRK26152.1 tetratricopeptide repeat protein [Chitinophagales bacterium]
MQTPLLRIYLLCLLLTASSLAFSEPTPKEILQQANQQYQAGNYNQAIQLYESLTAAGWQSASLYHNMGNAYYQQKQTANAILYYERALRLRPNNKNTQNNLSLAKSQITQPADELPTLFYLRWWHYLLGFMPAGGWAAGAVVCLWVAAASGIGFMRTNLVSRKKITFALAVTFLALAIILHALAFNRYDLAANTHYAIVMQENTAVRKGPSDSSDEVNTLSAGVKVRTNEQTNGWARITLPDNREGWVNLSALTTI